MQQCTELKLMWRKTRWVMLVTSVKKWKSNTFYHAERPWVLCVGVPEDWNVKVLPLSKCSCITNWNYASEAFKRNVESLLCFVALGSCTLQHLRDVLLKEQKKNTLETATDLQTKTLHSFQQWAPAVIPTAPCWFSLACTAVAARGRQSEVKGHKLGKKIPPKKVREQKIWVEWQKVKETVGAATCWVTLLLAWRRDNILRQEEAQFAS